MKATTSIGMTMQLIDKNNGQAIRRKWFGSLSAMEAWLGWQYPNWQKRYSLEIFYDETD